MPIPIGIDIVQVDQVTPSSSWVINHGLGYKPVAEFFAYDGATLKKAYPLTAAHTDDNTITATWTQPYAGFVKLAGKL